MRLSFRLAARSKKKTKKKVGGGRRSMVKDDSKSAATCREIPEDILMEILARLPGKSLMRFKCVSRHWFSLISSKYFINRFFELSSSMTLRRRVFFFSEVYMLFSSSPLKNLDETGYFLELHRDSTLPGMKGPLEFVNSLRGLMCFRVCRGIGELRREIRIINFATGQVLTLPLVKSNMLLESDGYMWMWNYFGYDHLNDEYKVLSKIIQICNNNEFRVSSETQVLVLGAGASWRNTKSLTSSSPPHHRPYEGGISFNGVLYYAAWSNEKRCVLMSFDWNSEEFHLIEFPKECRIMFRSDLVRVSLMNYQGQLALLGHHYKNTLHIWVAEDIGKSIWSSKEFVLPYDQLSRNLDCRDFEIRGTGRSGEITLSGLHVKGNKKNTYAFYDLEKNRITSEGVFESPYGWWCGIMCATLWDDVESIMYLEA